MSDAFVVVGANLCGAAAVQALRAEGFDGPIVLVGDEPHPPYERPPLSKEYLRGEEPAEDLVVHPESWFGENGVEARFGARAVSIDARERTVELEGGERLRYEALLLATGGRPRRLGAEPSERVLYLRTVEDADRVRAHLGRGSRLVVVGAGFIGAEVAASARTLGVDVTVLEVLEVPLARVLGEELGRVYAAIHRDEGVDLRLGEGVDRIEETGDGVLVTTTRGAPIEGEAVLVGVGIEPNVELARGAGLALENGILVDAHCRTSAEGVYAAGDVASHEHPLFGRIRVEHFDNALKQGAAAARNMLGKEEVFDDPHWFWSDQYEHNLQMAGVALEWDEIVIRGSVEDRSFSAFYLKDGVVRSVLGMNRGREVRNGKRLVSARAAPDPALLRDEDVDLKTLVPGEAG